MSRKLKGFEPGTPVRIEWKDDSDWGAWTIVDTSHKVCLVIAPRNELGTKHDDAGVPYAVPWSHVSCIVKDSVKKR